MASSFRWCRVALVAAVTFPLSCHCCAAKKQEPITDGPSIQKAIDGAPGQVVSLPPGNYEISTPISISKDGSGLIGAGRIIQTRPDQPILIASHANDVLLRDLVLT